MNKKQRDAQKQQAMQQMMQQAQMEQQMAAQQQQQGVKEEGANYRAELGAQAKMAGDAVKAGLGNPGDPEDGMMAESENQNPEEMQQLQ
jgi:hypothetical protein